ncbi:MAG: 2-oxoacid:acceptor oxidoreductase subunit alpha [Fibrobacterota bacterium]
MKDDITIRITGMAGQGIVSAGQMLLRASASAGYHVFSIRDYESRIRGGENYFQVRVSTSPCRASMSKADIIFSLNKETASKDAEYLSRDGVLIADSEAEKDSNERRYLFAPIEQKAKEAGKKLYSGTVGIGIVCALAGIPLEKLKSTISNILKDKDDKIRSENIKAAEYGYNIPAKNNFKLEPPDSHYEERVLMDGSAAVGGAALEAGCSFYCAYPMTPATGIMKNIVKYSAKYRVLVEQAEDEIAAVNMVLGAAYSGRTAMTGTSGGGFALMTEGLSLAGMTETPLVLALVQRPGPATGFPTRTEQGDLNFALHAGHGEFAKAVFAPSDPAEAWNHTLKAFETAYRYQVPVIILSDQYLADSEIDLDSKIFNKPSFKYSPYIPEDEINYKRYQLTDESPVSPAAAPGTKGVLVYADSDEHTEEGHITEDAAVREKMIDKRLYRKTEILKEAMLEPQLEGDNQADYIVTGFGSTAGIILSALSKLTDYKTAFLRVPQLWPFPSEKFSEICGRRPLITVENNAGAQFAGLIRRETGIKAASSILKYNGRPFYEDELISRLKEFLDAEQ